MKFRSFLILIFLFAYSAAHAQISLNDFLTVTVIDSVKNANGYGILGYKNLHIKTNGEIIDFAAKKVWVQDGVDTATIVFGERVNGKWQFSDIHTPDERLYATNVRLCLDEQLKPLIFYKDRSYEDGWLKNGVINVLQPVDGNWENSTVISFDNSATKGERFDAFGSGKSNPGFILLEKYWSDEQQKDYWAYTIYDYEIDNGLPAVVYNLDSLTQSYHSFTLPAVTEDGDYFAHSCIIPTSTENLFNVGLFVYKRNDSNNWTLDFKYVSDTLFSGYSYLYPFSITIGKDANGEVFLLAKNSEENPFFKKIDGTWHKIEDNYPTANGINSPGASNRSLNNEKIRFASDGTIFWGDIDGCPTNQFSAETSFKTPDDHWGVIYSPPAPGYKSDGGQFCHHDFTITDNDSLIIIYEFAPYDPANTIFLVEAKGYIPDIVNKVTEVKTYTEHFKAKFFTLYQNFPNPFNPKTKIRFDIAKTRHVTLKVYDLAGREIETLVNETKNPGHYEVTFDAAKLASGVYLYRLNDGISEITYKMIFMK